MNNLNAAVISPKEDENGNTEAYFSWHPCDNCNSKLGGNRYDVLYKESLDQKESDEASICEECYLEFFT